MTAAQTIHLRPIQNVDEAFLRLVYASVREQELDQVAWPPGVREEFLRTQFDAQHTHYTSNYPGAELSVIEMDGKPAGRFYTQRSESEIRIIEIALLPEYRNQGIGSGLVKRILNDGDLLHLPVAIHVEKFNPAFKLYERLGFRVEEDLGVYLFMKRMPLTDGPV